MKRKLINTSWRIFSSLLFVSISLVSFVACKLSVKNNSSDKPNPNVSVTKYGVQNPINDYPICEYGVEPVRQDLRNRNSKPGVLGLITDEALAKVVDSNEK